MKTIEINGESYIKEDYATEKIASLEEKIKIYEKILSYTLPVGEDLDDFMNEVIPYGDGLDISLLRRKIS